MGSKPESEMMSLMLKANNGSSCHLENELQEAQGGQPGTDQVESDGALNLGHSCEDGGK